MNIFFTALMVLSIVFAILAVVNPEFFKDKKTGEIPKRGPLFGGFMIFTAVFLLGVVFTSPKDKEESAQSVQVETVSDDQSVEKTDYCVIENFDNFKESFNKYALDAGSELRITGDIIIDEGEYPTFKYMLNSHIGFIGTLTSDKKRIKSLMMIGSGDGTSQSGVNLFVVMGGIVACVNPEFSAEDRIAVLKGVGFLSDDVDLMNHSATTERGDIIYSYNSAPQMGIIFGADNMKNGKQ